MKQTFSASIRVGCLAAVALYSHGPDRRKRPSPATPPTGRPGFLSTAPAMVFTLERGNRMRPLSPAAYFLFLEPPGSYPVNCTVMEAAVTRC